MARRPVRNLARLADPHENPDGYMYAEKSVHLQSIGHGWDAARFRRWAAMAHPDNQGLEIK